MTNTRNLQMSHANTEADRRNAIALIPFVESQGFRGMDRFVEVGRRLVGVDADLIRGWWNNHVEKSPP